MAIELSLFPKMELKNQQQHDSTRMDRRRVIWSYMGITLLEPTKKAGKNPCANCWARELCDGDDCGRKLYPIDVK